MINQNPLTVLTIVDEKKSGSLRLLLDKIYKDVEANDVIPFVKFTRIHFARFVIIESSQVRGVSTPTYLAFSTNFDGELRQHLDELFTIAGKGFDQVYDHCTGYDGYGDMERRIAFFERNMLPFPNAFYNGHRGLSVSLIKIQNDVRNAIQDFLNNNPQGSLQPAQIRQNILDHLNKTNMLGVAPPEIKLDSVWPTVLVVVLVAALIWIIMGLKVLGSIIVLMLLILLLLYTTLRRKEKRDPQIEDLDKKRIAGRIAVLQERENFNVQNQLTHIVPVKEGWFRLFMLKLVLGGINFLARTVYNKGKLGNIPTIHFARWVLIDDNKRLLFFSNFDGSWESYLGDFIDKAAVGLTGVWSNTLLFPRTKNLVQKGATDEERFKYWTRMNQIPTQVWYSAYKSLAVVNVSNNNEIYQGLFRNMNQEETIAWLRRL